MFSTFKVILKDEGYTLIELLFTIAILLIIAVPMSTPFVIAHMNNSESKTLEQAMLLGQKILENKMSDGDIDFEESPDVLLNPPVSQASPFEGLKVQTIVTAITQGITVEKDLLGADKTEPTTPVEVIEGITGKRTVYKLPLDPGISNSEVDSTVRPIGSAVEDYNYNLENLEIRSSDHPEGMDAIFHLEAINIRRSTETAGVTGQDITLSFDPVAETDTSYKLTLKYGNGLGERELAEFLNLVGLTASNKKMRIAFVIDNENTLRQIKLVNKPTFSTEIYVIRGLKDTGANTYYSGVGTGLNAGKSLLSLNYGTEDGSGSYLDNDPKVASDLIQVRANFKSRNETLVRTNRLYEIRVRVFNETDDEATATPIVELRTYRRAVL